MNTRPATKDEFDAFLATYPRTLEANYSAIGDPPVTSYYDWTIRPDGVTSLADLAACRVASICHEYDTNPMDIKNVREWKEYRILK